MEIGHLPTQSLTDGHLPTIFWRSVTDGHLPTIVFILLMKSRLQYISNLIFKPKRLFQTREYPRKKFSRRVNLSKKLGLQTQLYPKKVFRDILESRFHKGNKNNGREVNVGNWPSKNGREVTVGKWFRREVIVYRSILQLQNCNPLK
jgi:hypothetical protein